MTETNEIRPAALPQRAGPRPRTTPTNPHVQLDQNAPVAMQEKLAEYMFGFAPRASKLIGPIRQVMVQGLDKVDQLLTLTMAAYNLTRLRTLAQLRPQCAQ